MSETNDYPYMLIYDGKSYGLSAQYRERDAAEGAAKYLLEREMAAEVKLATHDGTSWVVVGSWTRGGITWKEAS